MKTNLKSLVASSVLAVSLLSNNFAQAGVVGGDGSGGGNALFSELVQLSEVLGQDGKNIKLEMLKHIRYLKLLEPINFHRAEAKQLLTIIQNDLESDIVNTNYIIGQQRCFDENGYETHASTKKINLINNPNQRRQDICINLNRLVRDKISFERIVALMFHEHARHFGYEDTDNIGNHPISTLFYDLAYARNKYVRASLNSVIGGEYAIRMIDFDYNNSVKKISSGVFFTTSTDGKKNIVFTPEEPTYFKLINMSNACNKKYLAIEDDGEVIRLYPGETYNLSKMFVDTVEVFLSKSCEININVQKGNFLSNDLKIIAKRKTSFGLGRLYF